MTTRIETTTGLVKNVALFLVSPVIALVYIVTFPLIGLAMLAVMGVRAAGRTEAGKMIGRAVVFVVMLAAAPILTLSIVMVGPFIGLLMLAVIALSAFVPGAPTPRGLRPATA